MSESKTWLVTGGSRGIGRAVVENATARGDRVAVFARKPATEQWTHPERVVEIPTDISDASSLGLGVDTVFETFGSLDVVVNAAACIAAAGSVTSRAHTGTRCSLPISPAHSNSLARWSHD